MSQCRTMSKGVKTEIALLEAIRQSGSITGAAEALGVSYRTAWDLVRGLNNQFAEPLVAAKPGGKSGGGASVTAAGEKVLTAFHQMESRLERLRQSLGGDFASNLPWGLSMKTSARNLLQCKVVSLTRGAVNCEVALDCGGDDPLIAIITQHSADDLQLAAGSIVYALINPSFVIVAREEGLGRSSARNYLRGEVVARKTGR